MKTRPILYNGPMVRRVLDRSKTQTRRMDGLSLINFSPNQWEFIKQPDTSCAVFRRIGTDGKPQPEHASEGQLQLANEIRVNSKFGSTGDRLYVRETWCLGHEESTMPADGRPVSDDGQWCYYRATEPNVYKVDESGLHRGDEASPWRPSIHMPKWASRIMLDIVSLRVERIQDITEADAIAEGATFVDHGKHLSPLSIDGGHTWGNVATQKAGWSMCHPKPPEECLGSARIAFANAWIAIYGQASWDRNDWVWVIEQRMVTP